MHRVLTNPPPGVPVNHKNGDTLDNRRGNLIVSNTRRNLTTERIAKSPHGFFGIWAKHLKTVTRWKAAIRVGRNRIYLGYFKTAEDAARAYDRHAVAIYGIQAETNFPLTDYISELPNRMPGTLTAADLQHITDAPF